VGSWPMATVAATRWRRRAGSPDTGVKRVSSASSVGSAWAGGTWRASEAGLGEGRIAGDLEWHRETGISESVDNSPTTLGEATRPRRVSLGSVGFMLSEEQVYEVQVMSRRDSRTSGTSMKPSKSIVNRVGIGPVGALELDGDYQKVLQSKWKNDVEQETFWMARRLEEHQMRQFYDFLANHTASEVAEVAKRHVDHTLHNVEAVDADMRRGLPAPAAATSVILTKPQTARLVAVLEAYAALSHQGRVYEDSTLIFRPTFCRFLVDSSLVAYERERKGRPGYHYAVRLFDAMATRHREAPERPPGGKDTVEEPPLAARAATCRQCANLVGQLLGQMEVSPNVVWSVFEVGLQRAEQIATALLAESRRRADAEAKRPRSGERGSSLHKRLFEEHWSPPTAFEGDLGDWNMGIKHWAAQLDLAAEPGACAVRGEASRALEWHLRNILLEPDVIHVLLRFDDVFKRLFTAYCDEEQVVMSPPGAPLGEQAHVLQHMTFSAFLRFCMDFSLFPSLCSFEELWGIYLRADGLQPCRAKVKERMRRAFIKVKTMRNVRCMAGMATRVSSLKGTSTGVLKAAQAQLKDEPMEPAETMGGRASLNPRKPPTSLGDEISRAATAPPTKSPGGSFGRTSASSRRSADAPPVLVAQEQPPAVPRSSGRASRLSPSPSPSGRASGIQLPAAVPPGSPASGKDHLVGVSRSSSRTSRASPSPSPSSGKEQPPAASAILPNHARAGKRVSGSSLLSVGPRSSAASVPGLSSPTSAGPRSAPGSPANSKAVAPLPLGAEDAAGEEAEGSVSAETDSTDSAPPTNRAAGPTASRLKLYTDSSWLSQPFGDMSGPQKSAYALLSALCDCSSDRFQPVRRLLMSTGGLDAEGFIDARGLLMALDTFDITHTIGTEEEMCAIMRLIDSECDDKLDAFSLEKSTEYVRENRRLRWPDIYDCEERAEAGLGDAGGGASLGAEARRLSDKVGGSLRFGPDAFVESLLFVGVQHMYCAGTALKSSASGGVMALWLVVFLHSRFDDLRLMRETAAKEALLAGEERLPFRPPPAVDMEPGGASECSTRAPTRPSTRQSTRPSTRPPSQGSLGVEAAAALEASQLRLACELAPKRVDYRCEPRPPVKEARYETFLDRLLGERPDLFEDALLAKDQMQRRRTGFNVMPPRDAVSGRREPAVRLWQMAGLPCETCSRKRDARGIGAMFCHDCSGVDDTALAETSLSQVFERRGIRQEIKALRRVEVGK